MLLCQYCRCPFVFRPLVVIGYMLCSQCRACMKNWHILISHNEENNDKKQVKNIFSVSENTVLFVIFAVINN